MGSGLALRRVALHALSRKPLRLGEALPISAAFRVGNSTQLTPVNQSEDCSVVVGEETLRGKEGITKRTIVSAAAMGRAPPRRRRFDFPFVFNISPDDVGNRHKRLA
jgi:hypothetical protein